MVTKIEYFTVFIDYIGLLNISPRFTFTNICAKMIRQQLSKSNCERKRKPINSCFSWDHLVLNKKEDHALRSIISYIVALWLGPGKNSRYNSKLQSVYQLNFLNICLCLLYRYVRRKVIHAGNINGEWVAVSFHIWMYFYHLVHLVL